MTTPAHIREAEEASAAFQLALAQIGVETTAEALELWESVNPARLAATAQQWLDRAVQLILTRRRQSRALAMAYYRLARALRTGRTVADPTLPSPRYVTLEVLRGEFRALAGVESDLPPDEVVEPSDEPEPEPGEPSEPIDEDRVPVEEIEDLRAEEERREREAEEEARLVLDALGPANIERQLEDLGDDRLEELSAREVDELREQAHAKAGARQAAAASRVARNGGRDLIKAAGDRDERVLGYVRLSRTGTPCGWCAMLLSRGFTPKSGPYRSQSSAGPTRQELVAGTAADVDRYHDNCNCYAEPVYSREQLNNSPLFALNRRYAQEWPRVTRGTSGRDALSVWRKYIRSQQD
ncbi:hypothetical protein CLV30_106131 [Haloactinopolyspora alba]|uniref:Minor capsid protein 2 n=1 Tax=Haloactinopolyspora alba TaxID=648780 RepID=A0A2P8E3U8_9ACTN|nr:hypothetical protein [Haloactinopolyspora alba]PSL04126.1 hypothetical protein CLV30_106131 [Haloactinopolyspora alba]